MRGIVLAMVLAPIGIDEAPVGSPRFVPGRHLPSPWVRSRSVAHPPFEDPTPIIAIPTDWPAVRIVPAGF